MKDIGEFLKAKRLEKGLTIDQIVEITRMPATRVKAIEEGNITLFKDDMTYLHFFVKAYCKALEIDYSEIKDKVSESINGYTMTFQAEQLRIHEESEKHIREKSNERIREFQVRNKPKQVKRKIDFSLISFVSVIIIIALCLLFVGGKFVISLFDNPEPPIVDETPNHDETPDKPQIDQPSVDPIIEPMSVVQGNNVNTFIVKNAVEKFTVRIEFWPNSWFLLSLDGVEQNSPKPRIYSSKEKLEFEIDPSKCKEASLNFGYFANMRVYINDEQIQFDESIAKHPGRQTIMFKIGE